MAKKCLFFAAGPVPTGAELALVARLAHRGYIVGVRNALVPALYGANLEAADAVAGTLPAAISTAIANYPDGNVTPTDLAKAEDMKLIAPGSATFAHTGTLQLVAVKADLTEDESDAVAITDITTDVNIAYASSDVSKATVNSTGLVTGVAAGACTITATYTYQSAHTQTATKALTLT